MPAIVKMQLASEAPYSSLEMCLLFNYLQEGGNGEMMGITENKKDLKGRGSTCQMIYHACL